MELINKRSTITRGKKEIKTDLELSIYPFLGAALGYERKRQKHNQSIKTEFTFLFLCFLLRITKIKKQLKKDGK